MKNPIRNLFFTILLTLLSLTNPANATKQGVLSQAELEITLTMQQDQYNATEPLNMVFSVNNTSENSIQLLKWNTPLEGEFTHDMLSVEREGKQALYMGKTVKRAPPQDSDYVTIAAGESLTAILDMATGYAVEQTGSYNVTFKGKLYQVVNPAKSFPLKPKFKKIQSHALKAATFELTEKRNIEKPRRKAAVFTSCDTDQQAVLNTALVNAVSLASESITVLNNTPATDLPSADRYVSWFGAYTAARHQVAATHFTNIHDALANQQVQFDCSCTDSSFAYVNIYNPYVINLCNAFWTAGATGTDSQAGTLVHEASHFIVVADTDDHVYGSKSAKNLALTNPDDALDNADNHEYFAENNPELSMQAGTFIAKVPDGYEVDNTKETATEIISGNLQNHTIVPITDQDWLTFTLASSSNISIETSGVEGDTVLELYNGQGVKIAENDDIVLNVNRFSKIVQSNLPAGTYYVKIIEYGANDEITYVVSYTAAAVSGSIAITDTYTVVEGGSILLNPLGNDTHSEGDALSIYSINGAAITQGSAQNILVPNGAVAITSNGVMTFTPTANYHGVSVFSYTITDGKGGDATAEIAVTVTEKPVGDQSAGGAFNIGFLFLLGVIGIYSRKKAKIMR